MARGGARPGAGRPPLSTSEHLRRGTYRPDRHGPRFQEEHHALPQEESDKSVLDVIEPPPRRVRLLGGETDVMTDGPWIADFTERFCTLFEGSFAGQPMILYPGLREFIDEAFRFDADGHRIYNTAGLGVPRKNAKSHSLAGIALALGSPAEGERKPEIILAAGSDEQADEVFEPCKLFVKTNPILSNTYVPWASSITCEDNLGSIYRVSADGRLRHGANPYVVIADELHAWTTPKQVELWAALKTSFGARDDWFYFFITTAGWNLHTILGEIWTQARHSPLAESRPDMGPGGFTYRDPEVGSLLHWFGVSGETELDDIDAWKAANPAPWRTKERIAADLADPWIDEATKRRLYGNQWTSARSRWISAERWSQARDPKGSPKSTDWIPDGAAVYCGADGAVSYDTASVAWAWRNPETGKTRVRTRVWSVRSDAPHHELVGGGRMDMERTIEPYVRELAKRYSVREIGYDPRYLEGVANHLNQDGMIAFPIEPTSRHMRAALSAFYRAVEEGTIEHDGDPVLAAHIAAAEGRKTDRGWDVHKANTAMPVDALFAVIMAHWRATRPQAEPWVFVPKEGK